MMDEPGLRDPVAVAPAHGLQFPGRLEISATGASNVGLEHDLVQALTVAGLVVHRQTLRIRLSAKGNYVSVGVAFDAATRADYDLAHAALRRLPAVKWTL